MSPKLLTSDDTTVRTQITLTAKLKQLIEQQAAPQGLSLSEYLRRAAILKLQLERQTAQKLQLLSKLVVGSVNLKDHPEWSTPQKINSWVSSLRSEWPI